MNEFKALSLDDVCEKILKAKNPVIIMHRSPDGDTVGSAISLWHIFSLLNKKAGLVCADNIPKRLEFLLKGCENKVFSSYSDCDFISVDVASPAQMGNLPSKIPESATPYLMIDHHNAGTVFADHYVRDDACATGEIIFDIATHLQSKGLIGKIPPLMVNSLYASISSDSGCFKYSNVTPHTHIVAASLLNMGADASEINRLLFDSKSEEILKAEGFALSKMKSFCDGKISLVTITKKDREALSLDFEFFETAIDVVRSLDGVEVAVAIKELDDSSFKISMRSTNIDVSELCSKLGGGGHIRAAGCTLNVKTEKEAEAIILEKAKRALGL